MRVILDKDTVTNEDIPLLVRLPDGASLGGGWTWKPENPPIKPVYL